MCKINFRWYTSKETRELQWRDLTGPEKVRLFNSIDIHKYLPKLKNAAAVQDIWKEFWRLFNELEKPDDVHELQEEIKNSNTEYYTIYPRLFAYHVPEFIEKFGSVCKLLATG